MLVKYLKPTIFHFRNAEKLHCTFFKNIWTQKSRNGLLMVHESFTSNQFNPDVKRSIPLSSDEFTSMKALIPSQPEDPHLLRVSILGEPNAGKSTLTNSLVKWKVCAVSRKVHTTRKSSSSVLVDQNKQIVFLDTPGFVTPEITKKHSLEPSFVMDPQKSVREAELIAVVVDISNKWTNNRINSEILRTLYAFQEKETILVLNKVDVMKSKNRILNLVRTLTANESENKTDATELTLQEVITETNKQFLQQKVLDPNFYEDIENKRGWPLFANIFMVSALQNDGVEDLRNYLLSRAKPNNWMYNEGIVTDIHPHEIAKMTVRENLLEYLPNEIPYTLNIQIAKWEILSTGCPKININIICANSRHRSFVIGPNGRHIASCVEKSRKAMRESFRRDVVLNLAVI